MTNTVNPILSLRAATSGYGQKQVLIGVDLAVSAGEIVALIGHNGAGKSTLLKVAFGLLPLWNGELFLDGKKIVRPRTGILIKTGVRYVMQGNRVFSDLSVQENLELGGITAPDSAAVARAVQEYLDIFPDLRSALRRHAGNLSGGQRQALALTTALVTSPRLLLLDEPSLGLSPALSEKTFGLIRSLCKAKNIGVVIVEQKVRPVLHMADRVYVLRRGAVSYAGDASLLDDNAKLKDVFF